MNKMFYKSTIEELKTFLEFSSYKTHTHTHNKVFSISKKLKVK